MVNFYNNLSPTTKLVLQSFLAVLLSVLAGVAIAAYQSYTQAGVMDLQALLNVCLVTFALLFGKAMHDWVPAHAQELIKAGNEEKAALYDALQRSQQISASINVPQNTASFTSGHQLQPIVVQAQQPLTTDHIQELSKQIALNLTNMATEPAQQVPQEKTPAPLQGGPAPYEDPLRISAVLPAYVPQVPFPGQAV